MADTSDAWEELIGAAMLKAPCSTADCRIHNTEHGWYTTIAHLDPEAHTCAVHGLETPVLTLSSDTLIRLERAQLVARVAGWLAHLHERGAVQPATSASASLAA